MEMQKTLGILVERIDHVRTDIDGLTKKMDATCDKVDKINLRLAWAAGICTAITAITVIAWAVVTQVPWDKIVNRGAPSAPAASNRTL